MSFFHTLIPSRQLRMQVDLQPVCETAAYYVDLAANSQGYRGECADFSGHTLGCFLNGGLPSPTLLSLASLRTVH